MEPDSLDEEQVDLRSFMADLFDAAQALAPRRWSLGSVPDAVILVDRAKLRGALLNLVDNAVKATAPGEFIALDARCDDRIVLAVSDGGRGIAPEDQPHLFERFVRSGDRSSRGAGLGLAIVRAVAEAHGRRGGPGEHPGDRHRGADRAARLAHRGRRRDRGAGGARRGARPGPAAGGGGAPMRVLIVEDDERIASFLTKGLKAEGYATLVARDGDEALAVSEVEGDALDLVLLDLGLPRTDGRTVLLHPPRPAPCPPGDHPHGP